MTNTLKNEVWTAALPKRAQASEATAETMSLTDMELKRVRNALREAARREEIAEMTAMIREFRMRGAK